MNRDIEIVESSPALDVEIYPGTEIMRDYVGSHATHSGNTTSGTVLIPRPSHSPDDPLVSFVALDDGCMLLKLTIELDSLLEMDHCCLPGLFHSDKCHFSSVGRAVDSCI